MPHTRPLQAHMIRSWDESEWQVFVALPDEPRWPHVPFPANDGIPTLAARTDALAGLGFVPLDGDTAWEWMETVFEGEPDGVVSLVATAKVTPLDSDPTPDS